MLTFLGNAALLLALVVSAYLALRPDASSDPSVRTTTMVAQFAPFVILASAFLVEARSLELVAQYVGEGLPIFYRISAVWGSRSGPLLMWASIMGGITWLMSRDEKIDRTTIKVMHSWISLILLVSIFLQPFSGSESGSSGEISPLLQTDLMVIHPPVVFVYYSLCLATASIAASSIIRPNSSENTHASMLRWARFAFISGTLGIGLGGLWAYTVLDWGGYWAWDPVETGSLLPWLALLGILHSRVRSPKERTFSATPALALITGALVMHATLVTRANGVWASVHAFVGDGENTLPKDPYVRVIEIIDFSPVGFEILSYLMAVVGLLCLAVFHLLREQRNLVMEKGSTTLYQSNRKISISLLLYFSLVGYWIGSSFVMFVGLSTLTLLIFGDKDDPPVSLISLGVLLMLFSSWGWVSEWYQALAGIAPFLLVWVLPEDEKDDFSWLRRSILDPIHRTRLSKNFPWYVSIVFLLLTWILLTVEIDGTNVEAHEYYGAPLIILIAIGLSMYAWGKGVSGRKGVIILTSTACISILFAIFSESFGLHGNPELPITDNISRGNLSLFVLTWLFFAIVPTLLKLSDSSRRTIPLIMRNGISSNINRARTLGSHISHTGILILLIGHAFTTTLIDRTDPSHFITLEKDTPTQSHGMELVFTGVEMISADDKEYDYSIGDGYVGVIIEVREGDSVVGRVSPGMLRFDSPSGAVSARSEIDRISSLTGDTVVILDLLQSNELLSSMILGQTENVEQVRVTVHHLPGSNLVWLGWVLILLGSSLASITRSQSPGSEDE